MAKLFSFLLMLVFGTHLQAQKVEQIVFNLYTDSLKKGFYNYISVDGRYADGRWLPLDTTDVRFTANTGYFKGNDLFIDSAYRADSVVVEAALRSNTGVRKQIIIYIRKRGFNEPLKTAEEILNEPRTRQKRKWKQTIG